MTRLRLACFVVLATALVVPSGAGTLFEEGFEDGNLAARGWYDNTTVAITTAEHLPGSLSSVEFRFPVGARTPVGGAGMRMLFTPTPSIYLRYYVKYSANYTGSNRPYHPHEFNFVSDVDSMWVGPAYTHLTLYVEQNEGTPMLAIQDGDNVDESNIGVDLTGVTELRAVAGCNGDSDGHGPGDCYLNGANHWNGKPWRAGRVYFEPVAGPYDQNRWHMVEALFELNTVAAGIGQRDGRIAYWYDGAPVFDHGDVVYRTGEWPGMQLNQLLVAPYIGDGSPVDQTMWVDNLAVATARVMRLLRNDEIAALTAPLFPALRDIFTGTGVSSLDLAGPDGVPQEGEGSREGTNGSDSDDDYYRADFASGALDPDLAPVVGDDRRPLVFYQVDAAIATLRLVRAGGTVRVSY